MIRLLCLFTVLLLIAPAGGPMTGWAEKASPATAEEGVVAQAKTAKAEGTLEGRGEDFESETLAIEDAGCPTTFGPIIGDTAVPIEEGKFTIQSTFGLGFVISQFTSDWRRASAGGDFRTFANVWKFAYGVVDDLEVYTVIPYIHNWAGDVDVPGPHGERSANSGGLGDTSLVFKYRLVEETQALPTVSALFGTTFPSGRFRHLDPGRLGTDSIGGGAYVFTTGLNLSKYVRPVILYGNLWYSMSTDFADDEGKKHPRDFVSVNLAAEHPLTSKWVACLELTSRWDGGRLFGHHPNVASEAWLSGAAEIGYMATEAFSLSLGVNLDLAGRNATANVTPLLSIVYAF